MGKKNTLLVLLFCVLVNITYAQKIWKKQTVNKNSYTKSELKFRKSLPTKFTIYSLDINALKSSISFATERSKKTILLPSVHGKFAEFLIQEDSNFSGKLNSAYGYIKSFSGQGVEDPTAVAKISMGRDGLHVMIMSGNHSTFYIDPYTKDNKNYIAYQRTHLLSEVKDFKCLVKETRTVLEKEREFATAARNADDALLRNYRLALACTGEFAQFHLNQQGVSTGATDAVKKAAVLSAMNSTMTRVNGVFERDLSVKMTIVLNGSGGNDLIFLDPNTDNLSNNDAGELIDESQSVCDSTIGSTNYDIGHTFSTGAGGLASIRSVCVNGQKGKGVTGTSTPINDPFGIDYVAHEIGHQFGGNHTFNNSCSANRNNSTAVEPGSGNTIMAYAGICSPNVQNNSDDHFHSVSIDQIWAHIQGAGNCRGGVATSTNNAIPTANAGADVSIPKSTPFVLKGMATDADGASSLTYNWEQINTEISTQPPVATNTAGPNFRSLPSNSSPNRYMPALSTVVNGSTSSTWEVVPSVVRTMNFSLVVRDNKAGGGASARDDIQVTVVDANPFTVTSQTTNETWETGTTQTITWDKSTTDLAPINTPNVKIKLSTDGGVSFPITLVESTPNNGSYSFTVPNHPTTNARIMVEAVGNIFFGINNGGVVQIEESTASIEDFNFTNFSLYPNPSNGEITVSFEVENTDSVTTQLYDIRGRKVGEKVFTNVSVLFSEKLVFNKITSGVYLLKISNASKQSTHKIIIK